MSDELQVILLSPSPEPPWSRLDKTKWSLTPNLGVLMWLWWCLFLWCCGHILSCYMFIHLSRRKFDTWPTRKPEDCFFFKVLRIPKSSLKILTLHMDEPLISYVEGLNAAGMDSLLITPVSQVWFRSGRLWQDQKCLEWDEMNFWWCYLTTKISWNLEFSPVEANARQRSGRAGRTGPGKCYRGKPRVVVADWDRSCFRSKLCKII